MYASLEKVLKTCGAIIFACLVVLISCCTKADQYKQILKDDWATNDSHWGSEYFNHIDFKDTLNFVVYQDKLFVRFLNKEFNFFSKNKDTVQLKHKNDTKFATFYKLKPKHNYALNQIMLSTKGCPDGCPQVDIMIYEDTLYYAKKEYSQEANNYKCLLTKQDNNQIFNKFKLLDINKMPSKIKPYFIADADMVLVIIKYNNGVKKYIYTDKSEFPLTFEPVLEKILEIASKCKTKTQHFKVLESRKLINSD